MEYLDYYSADGSFLGKELREKIHADGLWHKTVHCWLYDDLGNIYFQLRAENNKMYTTASGHVDAGETLNQAFAREVREEIGINVNIDNANLVEIVVWKMDKKKADGSMWRDRAFANVYTNKIGNEQNFVFDTKEVNGLIKINAEDALEILSGISTKTTATKIGIENKTETVDITIDDFLINPHEIGLIKYGRVLQFIIEETK